MSPHVQCLTICVTVLLMFSQTCHIVISSALPVTTNRILDFETFSINNQDVSNWAGRALNFFQIPHCSISGLGFIDECLRLSTRSSPKVTVYLGYDRSQEQDQMSQIFSYSALEKVRFSPNLLLSRRLRNQLGESGNEPHVREKVVAILPDSSEDVNLGPDNNGREEHDLVMVIDPYPEYNWGHLVGLFYVDLGVETGKCDGKHQVHMTDSTCITLGRRKSQRNCRIGNTRSDDIQNGYDPPSCYIDFLPTVLKASTFDPSSNSKNSNLLQCINIASFSSCPQSLPETNQKTEIETRCKLFQRCDRGILINGGWNSLHTTIKSDENLSQMESMLMSNGFLSDNINVFKGWTRKSLFKSDLRTHVTKICRAKHCADSLFIYINTPTLRNGNFLLWDANDNGIAEESEIYTLEEFVGDIENCEAQRVIIVSDQSRTENLLSRLQKSGHHQNVIIFGSGTEDGRTRNGELTTIWANHSHPTACLRHIQQSSSLWMKDSNSVVFDPLAGSLLNLSISGAPCGDFYSREHRPFYQGCQNLPTSIWFSLNYGEIGESSVTSSSVEIEQDSSIVYRKSKDGRRNGSTTSNNNVSSSSSSSRTRFS